MLSVSSFPPSALSHSDDSPASPTLLGSKAHEATRFNPADEEKEEEVVDGGVTAATATEKSGSASPKKRVCFEQTVMYSTADDEEATQPYASEGTADANDGETIKEREEEERKGTLHSIKMEGEPSAEDMMEVEPTVAYHLEENAEDSAVAEMSTAGGPTPTVPYLTEGSGEDTTVEEPRSVAHIQSPRGPGTSATTAEMPTVDAVTSEAPTGARRTRAAAQVEPTVPYLLESSEEEEQEEKGPAHKEEGTPTISRRVGRSHPEVKSGKREDERCPSASGGDRLWGEGEGESSESDLSDSIPALVDAGKHSKQKTLLSRQRGRGGGMRGKGSSASSGRKDSKAGGEKQRGKGRRGGGVKPKAVMEVEPTSSAATVGVTKGDAEDHKGKQRVGRRRNTRLQVPSKVVSESEATVWSEHTPAVRDGDTTDSTTEPSTSGARPPADSSLVDPLSEESPDIALHMTRGHSSAASSTSTPARVDPVTSKNDEGHSPAASSTSTPARVSPVASKSDECHSSSTSTPAQVDDPIVSNVRSSRGRSGSRGGRGRGKTPSTPRKGKSAKPALKSEGSVYVQPCNKLC